MKKLLVRSKPALKLTLLIVLLITTFVYAMFQGGFVSWFLFASFLPIALYPLCLAFIPLKKWAVTRTLNQNQFSVGEKLIGTVTIERGFPFPLAYIIVDDILPEHLNSSGMIKEAKGMLFPWFQRKIQLEYMFDSIPRGEHVFSDIRIKIGDLFGFYEKEHVVSIPHTILVYPNYVDMVYRQLQNRFDQGSTASRVRLLRDTAMAVGIREYQPGDRFSWIDWKASARKNDIMTKEFEQQQSHDVVIYMDRSKSMRQFEQVVTFTASLVRAVNKHGAQVGLVSIGSDRTVFPLRSSETHLHQIFYHLAKVQNDSFAGFAQVIEGEKPKFNQKMLSIFVTGSLSADTSKIYEALDLGNAMVFVVKEKSSHLTPQETNVMERLRSRGVFTKFVYEGHYADVFYEVSG